MAKTARGPVPPGVALQRDKQGSVHGGEGKTPSEGNRAVCVQVSLLFENKLHPTGILGYELRASDLIPGQQRNFPFYHREKLVLGFT